MPPGKVHELAFRTFVPECPLEKFMNWPFFGLVCRGDSGHQDREAWRRQQHIKIAVTQPRRVAALRLARRVAQDAISYPSIKGT